MGLLPVKEFPYCDASSVLKSHPSVRNGAEPIIARRQTARQLSAELETNTMYMKNQALASLAALPARGAVFLLELLFSPFSSAFRSLKICNASFFHTQVYSLSAKLKAQSAYINSAPEQSVLVYTEIRIALNYTCNQDISYSKLWSF